MADANESRDWRIYADFATRLIAQARALYASEDLGLELSNTVSMPLVEMHDHIRARHKRRYQVTTDSKHGLPVADNLLDRNFSPTAPNQVWTADITYLWTRAIA